MKNWLKVDEIPQSIGIDLSSTPRITYPQQGDTSDVAFAVDGSRDIVVKRCTSSIYLPWLRRENDLLRLLSSTSLRLPRVIGFVERVGPSGPEAWLTMSKIPGRPLSDLLLESPPDDRIELLRSFGSAVRTLHDTPAPTQLSGQEPWLSRKLNEAETHLAWCDGSADLLETLTQTKPDPVPETLVHGDLALDNVLVDASGGIGFIDWSGGDVGDPRYDLTLALDSDEDLAITDPEAAAFYSAYGADRLDAQTRSWFMSLWEFY